MLFGSTYVGFASGVSVSSRVLSVFSVVIANGLYSCALVFQVVCQSEPPVAAVVLG